MTRTNPTMQACCEALAAKHGIALDQPDAHLRLSMPGGLRLFLLVLDPQTVALSVSFGELRLLSLHFDTTRIPWVVIGFESAIGGGGAVAARTPEGVRVLDAEIHEEVATYAERLADELRSQGWLEHAVAKPFTA